MEYMFYFPRLYSAVHLNAIQHSKAEKGWVYPSHRHTFYEFLFCLSGEIEQWLNGAVYTLRTGHAMIIKGNAFHSTAAKTDCEFFDFHFDVEHRDVNTVFQLIQEPVIADPDRSTENSVYISDWVGAFIADFDRILRDHSSRPDSTSGREPITHSIEVLTMQSRVLEFVAYLAGLANRTRMQASGDKIRFSSLELSHEAALLLESRADKGLQINELARLLNVHRSHLNQCFKQVFGLSPKAYLSQVKLRRAKQLLLETPLSIEQISESLSFSSFGHFSRFFMQQTGVTPIQFRNSQR